MGEIEFSQKLDTGPVGNLELTAGGKEHNFGAMSWEDFPEQATCKLGSVLVSIGQVLLW